MNLVATGGKIFAARVGQVGANAVVGLIVARALGPAGNGHYGLTLAVVMFTAALLNGGMGLAAVPQLRRREISLNRMLKAQTLWLAAAAVLTGLILLGGRLTPLARLAADHLGWYGPTAAAAAVGVLALLGFEILFYDLLAVGRMVTGPIVNLFRAIFHLLLLGTGWLFFRLELALAVGAYVLAQAGAVLAVRAILLREESRPSAETSLPGSPDSQGPEISLWQLVRRTVARGWLGQVSALASLLHLRLDLALVSAFWNAGVVGVYWVAVLMGELLWLLPSALSPILVHSSAADPSQEKDLMAARAVRLGFGTTLAVALPLGLFARPLLELVFGPAYADSAPALQALLPGIVAFAPGAVLAGDFIGRGRPAWNAQASGLTVLVNVVCGLLLIPRHGAVGASWASTIAYGVGAGAMLFRFQRVTGLPWRLLLRPNWRDFRLGQESQR